LSPQPIHEAAIVEHGLRELLPENVDVKSGPGCPVCVTSPEEVDAVIQLSKQPKTTITTFGDMMHVPSNAGSLAEARAEGANVRVVYSIHDCAELARQNPANQYVHFAIGFETTAPTTAIELLGEPPDNFSIVSSHRLIPPAMEHLLNADEIHIDGFICPGHVSTIIGMTPYLHILSRHSIPQVIAGFEPIDILIAIAMILKQIRSGEAKVENEYSRSVRATGNLKAQEALASVFETCDSNWRGIGQIKASGYRLRNQYSARDAVTKFGLNIDQSYELPVGCKCGELLRGLIYPEQCPLFGTKCTISHPVGPCMVSREGSCYVSARFRKNR
jgi:hydrogenase expression/formation protein HypD